MIALVSEAVQGYMRLGWSIIPTRPGDKRPLVRWDEFQHRRPDEAKTCDWFRTWPDAGIGIVTGTVSGLVVLDVDVKHGGDVALQQLEREHARLPTTVECRTGGGGRHLYFSHPGRLVRNEVGLAPGIDIRADGGYVVAPPSLHASGLRYVWVEWRPSRSLRRRQDGHYRGIDPMPSEELAKLTSGPTDGDRTTCTDVAGAERDERAEWTVLVSGSALFAFGLPSRTPEHSASPRRGPLDLPRVRA